VGGKTTIAISDLFQGLGRGKKGSGKEKEKKRDRKLEFANSGNGVRKKGRGGSISGVSVKSKFNFVVWGGKCAGKASEKKRRRTFLSMKGLHRSL